MPRRSRRAPRGTEAGLEALLDELAPQDSGDAGLARLQRLWRTTMGPAIAAAGTPVAVVGGTLHLACRDATWAQELQLLEPDLLRRLHAGGATTVTAIRVRAGGR